MNLSLLVLRCSDLAKSREFYELFGLRFADEQHGTGPNHLSSQIGSAVLELYPLGKNSTSGLRFGIEMARPDVSVASIEGLGGKVVSGAPFVVRDPDGHTIEFG